MKRDVTSELGSARDRAGKRSTAICLGFLVACTIPFSAASSADLPPVYQASFLNSASSPSLDSLRVGALQPGFSALTQNPTFTPGSEGMTIGLTRPNDPTLVGPVGAGLFATPVSFGQGSIFALQATFVAPIGPHEGGNVWAAAVGARTGDQDDLAEETRLAATFQVRGDGARLNVVGATAPANQPNLSQPIYDSIFDPTNPQPFTLYLLVNRETGGGTAMLTVGAFTTSVNFLMAAFQANAGPAVTAVGPSLAVNNLPGQSASITVRDFSISSAVPEPNSWAMMLMGLAAVGLSMRRHRKAKAATPLPISRAISPLRAPHVRACLAASPLRA